MVISIVMCTQFVSLELRASDICGKVKNIPLVREMPANHTVVGGPKQTVG